MNKIFKGLMTLVVVAVLSQAVAFADYPFEDVDQYDPNIHVYKYLNEQGVFLGTSDGYLFPNSVINRAEMATILFRLSGEDKANLTGENCFSDVHSEWFAPYVCWAKEKGYIKGYGNTRKYGPEQDLKGIEVTKILSRFYGWDTEETDVWYEGAWNFAKRANLIVKEYNSPMEGIKRGDVAVAVFKEIVRRDYGVYAYKDGSSWDWYKKQHGIEPFEVKKGALNMYLMPQLYLGKDALYMCSYANVKVDGATLECSARSQFSGGGGGESPQYYYCKDVNRVYFLFGHFNDCDDLDIVEVDDVDVSTFGPADIYNPVTGYTNEQTLFKDKDSFYLLNKKLDVDYETFEVLDTFYDGDFYAKDKDSVYYGRYNIKGENHSDDDYGPFLKKIVGLDPDTFVSSVYGNEYWKDADHVVHDDRVIKGVDADTFELLLRDDILQPLTVVKDENGVYILKELFEDGSNKLIVLEGIDSGTVEYLGEIELEYYFLDKDHVYRVVSTDNGVFVNVLDEWDVATFEFVKIEIEGGTRINDYEYTLSDSNHSIKYVCNDNTYDCHEAK